MMFVSTETCIFIRHTATLSPVEHGLWSACYLPNFSQLTCLLWLSGRCFSLLAFLILFLIVQSIFYSLISLNGRNEPKFWGFSLVYHSWALNLLTVYHCVPSGPGLGQCFFPISTHQRGIISSITSLQKRLQTPERRHCSSPLQLL